MIRGPSWGVWCRCAALAGIAGIGSASAYAQQNLSHSFGPDQCGPGDPSYISTANATGGVPLFLQRSEAGKMMQLMRESTRNNVSTVLWASAKLGGTGQQFEIPVDSVTQRITFTFSVDTKGTRLVLKRPDGDAVAERSPRTEETELNCGRIITVEKPEPGLWRAEVSGSGTYWLQAQAQSDIFLIKAEFLELRGRIGHEGLFRIQGQPLAGEPATLQVALSATDVKTTEFRFVSQRGEPLSELKLKVTNPDREFLELTGDVALPTVPFRIAVSGLDAKGMRYQRFDGPLRHAETVKLTPRVDFDEIAKGATREAVFEVRNAGPARRFRVSAVDARKLVGKVEPAEIELGANGSGQVKVQLSAPVALNGPLEDNIVVMATSTTGPSTSNSCVVRLSITQTENAH